MGISYNAVLGVGVDQEEITFDTLTDHGKDIVKSIWRDSVDEEDVDENELNDILFDWFEENVCEYDLFYELGLEAYTGNMMCGNYYDRGVSVSLSDISKVQEEVDRAKDKFKSVVNLEPKVFHGVLVC